MARGLERPGPKCFVARGVNLKSVASTDILGSPTSAGNGLLRKTSQLFMVTKAWMVIQALTGSLTVGCTFSILGSNKGSTGSVQTVTVVASNTMSTSVVGQSTILLTIPNPVLACDVGSASGSIAINITGAATCTTMTADVWIEGCYV